MKPIQRDSLVRFLFEQAPLRGEVVHLDRCWQNTISERNYPKPIQKLLGEMMAASALLASTLKFKGSLTLQIQGDGPVSLMLMEATFEKTLRGLAQISEANAAKISNDDSDYKLKEIIGDGLLVITIDPGQGDKRYQGIVEITGDSLAECLEHYMATSQQLETRLWLAADEKQCGGMLLQKIPIDMQGEALEIWDRAVMLASTIKQNELLELPADEILHRLFHEEELQVFEAESMKFFCRCSREKVSTVLKNLGQDEIQKIIKEENFIDIDCEFCGQHYKFDAIDAQQIFSDESNINPSKLKH